MSGKIRNEVRRGFYLDSVALMRISADLVALDGIEDAVLMIGTEPNKAIMRDAGLLADSGAAAGADDLVIAVRATAPADADAAIAHAHDALEHRERSQSVEWRPKTLAGALEALPEANLALISTPGEFAVREARRAIGLGLNVMIFSDNVAIEDEAALKREAQARGLLVMGPDCGTAYVAGVPLAFANVIERGSVGIIAASGTGLQEVATLLSRNGGGVSHGIGVGGRDLDDAVGGCSTLQAIELLGEDPQTAHIVLISKPPGADTARRVLERLAATGKPATACLLGHRGDAEVAGVNLVRTLEAAARSAIGGALDHGDFAAERLADSVTGNASRRWLRGLFCGGTLCSEAAVVLADAGIDLGRSDGHSLIDLGADEFTRARPHPMIDPAPRCERLDAVLGDDAVAAVLIDVVLGHGAHRDPAGALCEVLLRHDGQHRPAVVASVCGTDRDPQIRSAQVEKLRAAGVLVAPSNAEAAALAARLASRAA